MKAKIELNFHYTFKLIDKFRLPIHTEDQIIDKDVITINDLENIFKYGKDKTICSIELISSKLSKKYKLYFYLYYGENIAYIQLDNFWQGVFEFIFINENNLSIKYENFEFKKFDTNETKDRKRFVLINYGILNNITINDKNYKISTIIYNNYIKYDNNCDSYQISVKDLKSQIFIVKPIQKVEEVDIKILVKYKSRFNDFSKDFEDMIKIQNQKLYKEKYSNIKSTYNYIFNKFQNLVLNRTNEYLNFLFKTNNLNDIELFWNYFLCQYVVLHKTKIKSNRAVFISFIKKIKQLKEQIKVDENLDFIEKIRIISLLFTVFQGCENKDSLNLLNIRYFIFSDKTIQKDSIMDKVFKFYDKFINMITEESIIFPSLLNIDSGYGYYGHEKVYTFDLTNIAMIKSHLRQLFPKVLVFYYLDIDDLSFNDSIYGGIAINEFHLFDKSRKKINYNLKDNNNLKEYKKDNIAIKIVLYLLHEYMGHKKFSFTENGEDSQKKIFNKQNKLIELKYIDEYVSNDEESEYILTSKNQKKGDSGHFLELCYGKYKKDLIMEILLKLKYKEKLIERPDIFASSEEILREYVILKKKCEENNIKAHYKKNVSIEKEIKLMKIKLGELERQKISKKKSLEKEEFVEDIKDEKNIILTEKKRNRDEDNNKENDEEDENDNDNDEEDNQIKKYKKINPNEYKKKISEKETISSNIKENISTIDLEEEEYTNEEILYNNIYQSMIKKFKFKDDTELRRNVINKLSDENLSQEDKDNLNFLLYRWIRKV